MRIASSDMIGAIPAPQARAIVRTMRNGDHIYVSWLTDKFGHAAVATLHNEGYMTTEDDGDSLRLTVKGHALALASFTKPTPRVKAQIELDGFLERVHSVNGNGEFMYFVAGVDLFGSFLDPEVDPVGDVDLAVVLRPRWNTTSPPSSEILDEWRQERLVIGNKTRLSYLRALWWPQREVKLLLKNRRPVLSIIEEGQPQELGTAWKRIYEAELTDVRPSPIPRRREATPKS